MIPVLEVQLGEYRGAGQLVEQVIDTGDGEAIMHGNSVDRVTIHAQSPRSILLVCEESGYCARAVAFSNEAAAEEVVDLSLEFRTLRRAQPVMGEVGKRGTWNKIDEMLNLPFWR